jgi:hypothetical protein
MGSTDPIRFWVRARKVSSPPLAHGFDEPTKLSLGVVARGTRRRVSRAVRCETFVRNGVTPANRKCFQKISISEILVSVRGIDFSAYYLSGRFISHIPNSICFRFSGFACQVNDRASRLVCFSSVTILEPRKGFINL